MAKPSQVNGKFVVLGVTGSIAAYKACLVARRFMELGAEVYVMMTQGATKFVTPLTFHALTGHVPVVDMFEPRTDWQIEHVYLAAKANLVVLAPCTAHVIGKIANGLADDIVTVTVMATQAPVVIAPAMNVNMYQNSIVQENIVRLKKLGYIFVGPTYGKLASPLEAEGEGRLAEPEEIVEQAVKLLASPRRLKAPR
ncbi:MAG: hypothetical protein HYZ68_07040 [Chloroflexi bacterium]|nr:hypothetical protein [Chloroflexota bacterium]